FCPDLAAVSTSSKEGAEISQTAIRLYVRRLGGAMICSLPTSRRSFGGFPFSLVALPWKRHQRYAVPVKGNWTSSMLSLPYSIITFCDGKIRSAMKSGLQCLPPYVHLHWSVWNNQERKQKSEGAMLFIS